MRSMSMQLLRLLMLAGICSVLLFVSIYFISEQLISRYFPGSELQIQMTEKRIGSFRDYIAGNAVLLTDTEALMNWCGRQPLVLMEIYRDDLLYFNSKYNYTDPLIDQNIKAIRYDWYSYYELQFADGSAEVLIYSDESYILNTWIITGAIVLSGVFFILIVLAGIRRTVRYIYLLCDEIQIMGSGNLEHPITVRGRNELGLLAQELDHMRSALFFHQQKEQKMIRQNNELMTGLSHDLRTPLTKLMLYTEIIRNSRYEGEEELKQYLARIHEKSVQMKEISEHILQYSLSKKDLKMPEIQPVSFRIALFDRLSEMTDYLSQCGFTVECGIDWKETPIGINELYLDRVLDNIVSNIEKYAEKSHPVEILSVWENHCAGIAVKNKKSSVSVRSDSNGVGIESICTLMRKMKGTCIVDQTETVFEILVLFGEAQD